MHILGSPILLLPQRRTYFHFAKLKTIIDGFYIETHEKLPVGISQQETLYVDYLCLSHHTCTVTIVYVHVYQIQIATCSKATSTSWYWCLDVQFSYCNTFTDSTDILPVIQIRFHRILTAKTVLLERIPCVNYGSSLALYIATCFHNCILTCLFMLKTAVGFNS